jgi:hypothetical protein
MRVLLWMIIFGLAAPAQAAMYKWVDEHGHTHYGDTLPQQATGRANMELDKQGLTIKKNAGAMTPEQRQLRAAELLRQQQELQVKTEQKQHDTALLNTYTSPAEIDLARDRNLEQTRASIKGFQTQLSQLRTQQTQLDQRIALATRSKQPVLSHITASHETHAREIAQMEKAIAQKNQEMANIQIRFDTDKARFIELSGTSR